MILGKRPRPNCMKKTISMTQLTTSLDDDLNTPQPHNPSDSQNGQRPGTDLHHHHLLTKSSSCAPTPITTTPTRNQLLRRRRHHSSDFHRQTTTAPFLQACNLCNRRLIPGAHDIYMYRGDSAFCSAECRQEQISQDMMMMMMINYSCSRPNSNRSEPPPTTTTTTTSGPKPKGEPPHVSVVARPVA